MIKTEIIKREREREREMAKEREREMSNREVRMVKRERE
jgi:hypothetical protein